MFVKLLLLVVVVLMIPLTFVACDQITLALLHVLGDRSKQQKQRIITPGQALLTLFGIAIFCLWLVATVAC